MKLTSIAGTFSLLNAQVNVGTLSKSDGTSLKGLAFDMGARTSAYPIPMSDDQAQALVDCLSKVERKELPAEFLISFGSWNLSSLGFAFKQYDPKWFHGGGVKGGMTLTFFVLGINWVPIEMSMESVSGLRACLQQFYGLKPKS